jgi:hypothetical protein
MIVVPKDTIGRATNRVAGAQGFRLRLRLTLPASALHSVLLEKVDFWELKSMQQSCTNTAPFVHSHPPQKAARCRWTRIFRSCRRQRSVEMRRGFRIVMQRKPAASDRRSGRGALKQLAAEEK